MQTFSNPCVGARTVREWRYLNGTYLSALDTALGLKIFAPEAQKNEPNYMNVFYMMTQSAKQSQADVSLMKEILAKMQPSIRASAWSRFCANELKRSPAVHENRRQELTKILGDLVAGANGFAAYKTHGMMRPAHPGDCGTSRIYASCWYTAKYPIAVSDEIIVKPSNYVFVHVATHVEGYLHWTQFSLGASMAEAESNSYAGKKHETLIFPCELQRY